MKVPWQKILPALCIGSLYFLLSLWYQAQGISSGDSGDVVTAAINGGIAHPPGYPLYSLLGFLLNKLPIYTPAWRVGLLSSFFHAATLSVIYGIVLIGTKKKSAALFSVSVLSGIYLFFFYSITQEVFALFSFFLVTLLFILLLYIKSGKKQYFFLFSFVFGLSLTHHHVILFAVPAFFMGLRMRKPNFTKKDIGIVILLGLLGLLPYAYAPLASRNNPIIYWSKPDSLQGFLKLVRRDAYGTFQSAGAYGESPWQRLLSLKAYLQFLHMDLGIFGLFFAGFGFMTLWKKNSQVAFILGLALLFLGPVFLFYASFPIINDFMLGTYERFLLPSFIILSMFIGIGMASIYAAGLFFFKKFEIPLLRYIGVATFTLLMLLYPLKVLSQTLAVTKGIANDTTANRIGMDILSQVKPNAILVLGTDTVLFNTQYVRYGLQYRPDTKVIHSGGLETNEYPSVIKRVFPELVVPEVRGLEFSKAFIEANKDQYPIYSNSKYPLPQGLFWVPRGLIYELTKEKDLPSMDMLISETATLFSSYQDTRTGVLQTYQHLMLVDVQELYAEAFERMGKIFLQGGKIEEAQRYFKKALEISNDTLLSGNYLNLGITQFLLNQCSDALVSFEKSKTLRSDKENPELLQYEIATYRECLKDEAKANELLKTYGDVVEKSGKILKQWQ